MFEKTCAYIETKFLQHKFNDNAYSLVKPEYKVAFKCAHAFNLIRLTFTERTTKRGDCFKGTLIQIQKSCKILFFIHKIV